MLDQCCLFPNDEQRESQHSDSNGQDASKGTGKGDFNRLDENRPTPRVHLDRSRPSCAAPHCSSQHVLEMSTLEGRTEHWVVEVGRAGKGE
jgi:hypothetical protein